MRTRSQGVRAASRELLRCDRRATYCVRTYVFVLAYYLLASGHVMGVASADERAGRPTRWDEACGQSRPHTGTRMRTPPSI